MLHTVCLCRTPQVSKTAQAFHTLTNIRRHWPQTEKKKGENKNGAHTGYTGTADYEQLVIATWFEKLDRFSAVIRMRRMFPSGGWRKGHCSRSQGPDKRRSFGQSFFFFFFLHSGISNLCASAADLRVCDGV